MDAVKKFVALGHKKAVVVLSGGMDSTTSLRLVVEALGAENVTAITFDYGQRQRREIELASQTCSKLGVRQIIIPLDFMAAINEGFSANLDTNIAMPTIHEVLGDPAPVTYVANRNMIMVSIAAAVAETAGATAIVTGFQSNDTYGYHDTTPRFVSLLNDVLAENRKTKIEVIAPFNDLSKTDEILLIKELDGNVELFSTTLTCYNPDETGASCGVCPSCSERLAAFKRAGITDPIRYQKPCAESLSPAT